MRHPKTDTPERPDPDSPAQEAPFAELLAAFEQARAQAAETPGEGRCGRVIAVSADTVFVDLGLKTEGVLPAASLRDEAGKLAVQVGELLRVSIKGRDPEGYYLLSLIKVERPKDWAALEKAFVEKRPIAGIITAQVKGGFSVDVGVRAFLPASRSGVKDPAEMEKLVGQEITCKITELDLATENVVVDRRIVLEEEEEQARQRTLAALKPGDVVSGVVRSLKRRGGSPHSA